MEEEHPSLGMGFLCCQRTYIAALALAHFYTYRPPNTELHAFVDKPRTGEGPPGKLLETLQRLKESGYLEGLVVLSGNIGLENMVSFSIKKLAKRGYDYLARFEDDMLVGPDLLSQMLEVFELSKNDERPIGLLGGQITDLPSSLRPIRFRRVGKKYIVGIHGVDNLEGLTLLRRSVEDKGFTWDLYHPKAYNNSWLNKLRKCGFEGGTIMEPVGKVQHIGHSTTVPKGTPVTPAKPFKKDNPIDLPQFRWLDFIGTKTEAGEEAYASKIVRQLAVDLEPGIAEALMSMFHGEPDKEILSRVEYLAPYDAVGEKVVPRFTRHPALSPEVRPVGLVPTPEKKENLTKPVRHQTLVKATVLRSVADF